MIYLPVTEFSPVGRYAVEIRDDRADPVWGPEPGVTVYSECCAETMSLETMRQVYEALGRYLRDHDPEHREGC